MKKLNVAIIGQGRSGKNIHGKYFRGETNLYYNVKYVDENGNEVWSLTNSDAPEINIRWLLGVQRLSNGNFVFTNCSHFTHSIIKCVKKQQKGIYNKGDYVWTKNQKPPNSI